MKIVKSLVASLCLMTSLHAFDFDIGVSEETMMWMGFTFP